jgi:glycosyltransferase involved in cell wall biosynthesis
VGDTVPAATCVDVQLHTQVVPVHEYLPAASDNQRAVSTMTADEALAYVPAYARALESVIDDVDVIYAHHANLTAIAAHDVARRHDKPFVLFLHGTGIEPRHHGGFDDAVWKRIQQAIEASAGILVTTDYVRDELVRPIVDQPQERFLVLPCGVDTREFHPDHTGDVAAKYDLPDTFVICPGALTLSKGPQNVVAASEIYSEAALTVFIGDGELREELANQAGDRARFLGFVPAEDKAQLINRARLLVAGPEKKEHFGIIYAEALAGGTPPVAYEGGGVASIVTPDVGVLTAREPVALGTAIAELLAAPARWQAMSVAGRQRAEKLFDYPAIVDRLESWLGRLCP